MYHFSCCSGRLENRDGRPDVCWLIHFQLLLCNSFTEFIVTLRQHYLNDRPLQSCFCRFKNQCGFLSSDVMRWLNYFITTMDWTQKKRYRKVDHNILDQMFIYLADRKTKRAVLASDLLRYNRVFSATADTQLTQN